MKSAKNSIVVAGVLLVMGTVATPVGAQQVYRCGAEYTNNRARIAQGGCTPLTTGNLTVVRAGARAPQVARTSTTVARRTPAATPAAAPQRVVDSAQRARDEGAKGILQMELDKANQRLAELQKEYNNGTPDKLGPETKNHQKYLDRVAELKSSIARTESDIVGIRRELGRAGG
ncbi:MAG: hypothetical protein Q4G39_07260 [Brachymonas sp.]|nr:hypothetical protein [Brachymonas sp.]